MPATNTSRHHGLLDLPSLRKRAKRLLKALKNNEADEARAQLQALGLPGPDYRLADAQWLLAREMGFASWPKLISHVDSIAFAARHPGSQHAVKRRFSTGAAETTSSTACE
ncbi:hypothetical protein EC915_11081 [Pseudomonas sp. LP_7_YM]|nr:hypothetical protein EC915_11081 [Pseudomonas sp. LP_7_YM]